MIQDSNSAVGAQPVLTMSKLGKLGRFGNQIFQYAFLRICAKQSGARAKCPPWIGTTLFGHEDPPVSGSLPPAVEEDSDQDGVLNHIPELIPWVEAVTGQKSSRISPDALATGITNVDLWGFFTIHTRYLAPHRDLFRSLYQPVPSLKSACEQTVSELRTKGKTLVGVHIRRGDYVKHAWNRFALVFPGSWYCEYLETLWPTLEDPILFVCSDDLDSVIGDFARLSPVTQNDLNWVPPNEMMDIALEAFLDFYLLSKCDIAVISNSTFSFAASMLNENGRMFIRPHWDFESKFIPFDPWDSAPLLLKPGTEGRLTRRLPEQFWTTYVTLGWWPMLQCLFLWAPLAFVIRCVVRCVLIHRGLGFAGILRLLCSTLGFRRAWASAASE
jgi:hypothetical protein